MRTYGFTDVEGPMPSSRTSLPDVELVEFARLGDRPAFDELLRRHDDRMRGLAYRLLADRHGMDDALQEAYLKAYRAVDRFPERAPGPVHHR